MSAHGGPRAPVDFPRSHLSARSVRASFDCCVAFQAALSWTHETDSSRG